MKKQQRLFSVAAFVLETAAQNDAPLPQRVARANLHGPGLAQDGEFYAEWCFGEQVAMGSWRVSLHTNTADGKLPFVLFITKLSIESCRIVEGMEALEFLEATLRPMSNTDVDGNLLPTT